MSTIEEQYVEMFKKVAIPFQRVAAERGEELTMQVLQNIVAKFMLMKSTIIGRFMIDSHLKYELEKFRREGLRADYLNP